MMWNSLILLAASMLWMASSVSNHLVIDTNSGKVKGQRKTAANGKEVDIWWGIPYAEPPIGDLRFRAPEPIARWSGTKEAFRRPNACIQIVDMMFPGFPGAEMWNPNTKQSEDCLYLNVAVPVPRPNNSAVMVWIYGGSFFSGTSSLDVYDPKTLATEQNIIVVSLNYRLASLGFLYIGSEGINGNQGLLDQRLAIQWIKENIAYFGGNPNNITLFSESAGSASVAFHLLSPGSRPYFSQAILQSAAATNPWAMVTKKEAKLRARRLAEVLECPYDDEGDLSYMAYCLRQVNATAMVNAEWDGIVFGIMGCPFTPVHDGDFFPDSPATALARENFKKTKILLGTNLNEGMYFVLYYLTDIFKKKENISISRKQFKDSVTELNPFVSPVGLHAIIYEYTWWMDPSNKSALIDAIDKMVGDYQFTCPVQEFAQRYAETFNDVYLYYFEHRASNNPWPSWTGVLHGDEIDYIFGTPLNDTFGFNDKEKQLSRDMMTYWANFARTGNPNSFGNGSRTSTYWPIYSSYDKEFLSLNIYNKSIGNGVRSRKCAFWKSYLPSLLRNEPTKECTVKCIEPEGCLTIKENLHSGAGAGNSKRFKNSSNFVLIIVITISLVILLSGGGLVFVGS